MCNWCKEDAPLKPMVSGALMPMICSKCGTGCGHWDYKQVRSAMHDSRKYNALQAKHDELVELVKNFIVAYRNWNAMANDIGETGEAFDAAEAEMDRTFNALYDATETALRKAVESK
jgi:hypothetical protein